uniref:Uncharacterized protein n=1 Tax=Eutreptiella gymnastica TaxID=73025 RepID=A0A7S1JBN1_9EUGL
MRGAWDRTHFDSGVIEPSPGLDGSPPQDVSPTHPKPSGASRCPVHSFPDHSDFAFTVKALDTGPATAVCSVLGGPPWGPWDGVWWPHFTALGVIAALVTRHPHQASHVRQSHTFRLSSLSAPPLVALGHF